MLKGWRRPLSTFSRACKASKSERPPMSTNVFLKSLAAAGIGILTTNAFAMNDPAGISHLVVPQTEVRIPRPRFSRAGRSAKRHGGIADEIRRSACHVDHSGQQRNMGSGSRRTPSMARPGHQSWRTPHESGLRILVDARQWRVDDREHGWHRIPRAIHVTGQRGSRRTLAAGDSRATTSSSPSPATMPIDKPSRTASP